MFEIIKVILDIFKSAFSIKGLKKEKELKELGTSLFKLYLNLCYIVEMGNRIVDTLFYYEKEMADYLKTNDNRYFTKYEAILKRELDEQLVNIKRFDEAIEDLLLQLRITDNKILVTISPLVNAKGKMIRILLQAISANKFPIYNFSCDDLYDFATNPDNYKSDFGVDAINYKLLNELKESVVYIPLNEEWDEKIYELVKKFLETKPTKTLEIIEKNAEDYKKILLENFDLKDILHETLRRPDRFWL